MADSRHSTSMLLQIWDKLKKVKSSSIDAETLGTGKLIRASFASKTALSPIWFDALVDGAQASTEKTFFPSLTFVSFAVDCS